jgi:hypothetical protein
MKFPTLTALLATTSLCACLSACNDSQPTATPAAAQKDAAPAAKLEAPKDTWKDFAFADGGFSIKVPADPTCQPQDAGSGLTATVCTTETEKTGLMITSTPLPGVVPPENVAKVAAGAMNGAAKNMQGELINPTDVDVGGVKGKDFVVKTAQGELHSRILIKGKYLIQVMGVPKADPEASKAEVEKFVTSLKPAG